MIDPAWTLPLYLARTAWAGMPYDSLVDRVLRGAHAHLLQVVGEPVCGLDASDSARGPAAVLPALVSRLRGARTARAPESLSLLTAAPGDIASVPPVGGLPELVSGAGAATLVRDPESEEAVLLAVESTGTTDVMRWTACGVRHCPVAPQPDGVARAGAVLGAAVLEAADLVTAGATGPAAAGGPMDLARSQAPLPTGLPDRVFDLLDRADHVDAIVDAALRMPSRGNAVESREPVLRRLRGAVDAARRAAVAATGEDALARLRADEMR